MKSHIKRINILKAKELKAPKDKTQGVNVPSAMTASGGSSLARSNFLLLNNIKMAAQNI